MRYVETSQVVDGKRYNVKTAKLLASDDWWDGNNYERGGTQCFLFRTPKGALFFQRLSQWQGSPFCVIEPCGLEEAIEFWHVCDRHDEAISWEDAFPEVPVEDA